MNRAHLVDALVEIRLSAKKNVSNPSRLRELIRGDLEQLTDDELKRDHDYATGANRRSSNTGDAVDYGVRDIDHAVSFAAHLIERVADGERTKTDEEIANILTSEFGPSIAGRALALALDGAFEVRYGKSHASRLEEPSWQAITLDEYRSLVPDAQIPRQEAS